MKRAKIDQMPKEVRDWLDAALIETNFSGYTALTEELNRRGYQISRSSTHRYGSEVERRLAAASATAQAMRLMGKATEDKDDSRTGGLMGLLQTEIYKSLLAMKELEDTEGEDPVKRAETLSKISKNASAMVRAELELKKHQKEADAEKTAAQESGSNGQGGVIEICLVDPPPRGITENDAAAPEATEGPQ